MRNCGTEIEDQYVGCQRRWLYKVVGTVTSRLTRYAVPLGDSITEITCWRAKLWDHLSDANVTSNIQFVGSMTDNPLNCTAADSDWDHHHEGHSGYLAINIANLFLASWLENAQPDVVMFMLGTNDVGSNFSTSAIIAAYTKMVQEMRSSNPNTTIIVSFCPFCGVLFSWKSGINKRQCLCTRSILLFLSRLGSHQSMRWIVLFQVGQRVRIPRLPRYMWQISPLCTRRVISIWETEYIQMTRVMLWLQMYWHQC